MRRYVLILSENFTSIRYFEVSDSLDHTTIWATDLLHGTGVAIRMALHEGGIHVASHPTKLLIFIAGRK